MKHLLATAISVTLLVASSTSAAADPTPTPGSGNGATGLVSLCSTVVLPNVPQANLGECVSYSRASDAGFPSHQCDVLREIYPDVLETLFGTYSDCVRAMKGH